MTLHDIAALPRDTLTAADVAEYLGCNAHSIRLQARRNPDRLGFPVIVIGSRVRIPKEPFIDFCKRR